MVGTRKSIFLMMIPSAGISSLSAIFEYSIDYSVSQLPVPARRLFGGSDNWLYVDPEYPESYPA